MSRLSASVQMGQGQKETTINENFQILAAGRIVGLKLERLAANSLRVTTGAAHIESPNAVLEAAVAITKSSLSLTNATWYHVYLYNNAGNADIEIVTTAPAAPYFGTARSKTGDTSRRYLGSVRAIAANTMANFLMDGNGIFYREASFAAPFLVLNAGTATIDTTVSLAAVVPSAARLATLRAVNTAPVTAVTGTSDGDATQRGFGPGADNNSLLPINSAQALSYRYTATPTSGGFYLDVKGYYFER